LKLDGFGKEMINSIEEFVLVNKDKIEKLIELIEPTEPKKEELKKSQGFRFTKNSNPSIRSINIRCFT
ncbi:MAG TPA: hypothetical protein EYP89_03180, partial [Candidatus Omnitrophica bacterium]|nr:hypothetical protein [Candidatus Omnitrophota bacterium]